jgi:hypothetical protein
MTLDPNQADVFGERIRQGDPQALAELFAAQRSTRRYCSDRCRAKAHRTSGTRSKKTGLRPGQVAC